jgi:cytosine/adenosine deaminase-related metal-dependent hydrolase
MCPTCDPPRGTGDGNSLGSDGVRDSWSPFGNADMLHRANLPARATGARLDDLTAAITAASDFGAELLGLPKADFKVGAPADFQLVRGESVPQIVVDVPQREPVVRGGRVVAANGTITLG